MNLFNTFTDTIILKKTSELQRKYRALKMLLAENPQNEGIQDELYMVKKGLDGENEIQYQLEKSNIGMYVLHDLNIEVNNLKAQIDYLIITKAYCYFIECKNLRGNINVDEKGDFTIEYTYKNQKKKYGIKSPLRQVEAQRDVYKKIWNNRLHNNTILNNIARLFSEKNFTTVHQVLFVSASDNTIINTKHAPENIKSKVIKADSLVKRIETDIKESNKALWSSPKEMENWAKTFLNINKTIETDYYNYYKNKYCKNTNNKETLKTDLINFRLKRSKDRNIPAFLIFNNKELDKIIELCPKTLNELKEAKILPYVKIKYHGEAIIKVLNSYNK